MSDLSTYSIETDHTVLLSFKDGRRRRVPMTELHHYLSPDDIATITRAYKLRQDFIRRHMPKAALVLVAGALFALAGTATTRVAAWLSRPAAHPAPVEATANPQPQIVRSAPAPAAPTPAPSSDTAAAQGAALAAHPTPGPAKPHKVASTKTKSKPAAKPTTSVGAIAAQIGLPATSPVSATPVTPAPPPSVSPSPSPVPSPTSTPIPNQGQVLGDSTGPDAPPNH